MEHQPPQPPAQSVKKSSSKLVSDSWNTHEQKLDRAQQIWTDLWENGVYQEPRHESKRVYIGSGEDVCLEML